MVAAHGTAALAVFFLMMDWFGAALGAALLGLGVASARTRALLRGRDAVRALELHGDDCRVELASGEVRAVRAAKRRYVGRWLVMLPLGGRTLLVTADMLDASQFRRLRVWALWGKLPAVAGKQLAG
jgi:hypothetical protein